MSTSDLKAQLAAIDMRSDQAEWDRVDALLEAAEVTPPPAHDAAAIAESKLAYLVSYHEITQSLIGIMRLHATPEQRAKVAMWDDALDDLQAARWHALGVPLYQMGRDAVFVIDDAAVTRLRASLAQSKGEE